MSSYQEHHENMTKVRSNKITSRIKKKGRWGRKRKTLFYHKKFPIKFNWHQVMIFAVITRNPTHLRMFSPDLTFSITSLIRLVLISWVQVPATHQLHLHTLLSIRFSSRAIWNLGAWNSNCISITKLQHFSFYKHGFMIDLNLFWSNRKDTATTTESEDGKKT